MGFFTDLFKEKTKWSYDELQALWVCTKGMAAIDGEMHEKENELITNYMNNLPKDSITDWDTFCESAMKIDVQTHFQTLKSMHKDKKRLALACIIMVADADGKIDDKEMLTINNLKSILQV